LGEASRCESGNAARTSYWDAGPYRVGNVKLEHTCSICFPKVVGDQCIIRTHIYYPSEHADSSCLPTDPRKRRPWPLAIISSGFLVNSDQYRSYAEQLASYGYVAVLYDKVENINSTIDDDTSTVFISEIINWCETASFANDISTESVYLVGHSRGGKISLLAAENDSRIKCVTLIDPVDSNGYAPEGPGYPSAIKQLRKPEVANLPIAIIGGGRNGDCIPTQSNYDRFFEGSQSPLTLELTIEDAGHFQFLGEKPSMMQTAVCSSGKIPDRAVRDVSKALIVAWPEIMLSQEKNTKEKVEEAKASVEDMKRILTASYGVQGGSINSQLKGVL